MAVNFASLKRLGIGKSEPAPTQDPTARGAREVKMGRRGDEFEHFWGRMTGFSVRARIALFQRLYRFTSRGIPMRKALDILWSRYNREKDARRAVFRRLIDNVANGVTISTAMAPYVPAAERLLIYAGEDSGKVAMGFEKAIFVANSVQRMRNAVIATLAYPLVLFVMLCGILYGMANSFVPVLKDLAPLKEWPPVSLVLYYVAMTVQNAGIYILIALAAVVGLIARTMPNWTGAVRDFLDRYILPWTIYREYQSAIFLISLSALIGSGRPDVAAIKQLSQIARPWLRKHLQAMHRAMLAGHDAGKALRTGLLHKEISGDIEDYAAAGAFDSAIEQIGKDSVDDAIGRITASASIIKYIMMFMVAGSILLIWTGMVFLVMSVAQKAQSAR